MKLKITLASSFDKHDWAIFFLPFIVVNRESIIKGREDSHSYYVAIGWLFYAVEMTVEF